MRKLNEASQAQAYLPSGAVSGVGHNLKYWLAFTVPVGACAHRAGFIPDRPAGARKVIVCPLKLTDGTEGRET